MADDGLSRDHTTKKIALVAHDNIKGDLLDWARLNRPLLLQHELYATGTTGTLLEQDLTVRVHKLQSGPLGGDQQVGARITEGEIDLLIFFWEPLQAHPHDPDVRALLRVAVLWNIPVACNRASADYMISSPLLSGAYQRRRPHTRRTENDPSQGPRWRSPAGRRAGRRRQRARRQPRKGAVMQARWPRDASCAVAPEAQYYLGVARYKASHEGADLAKGWHRLQTRYPESIWRTKQSFIER